MALPLVAAYFRRMGVVPAAPDSIAAALAAGHDVALWPGGERDSLRPWSQRDQAVLAGRTGFVKLAIRSGEAEDVPVTQFCSRSDGWLVVRGQEAVRERASGT